MFKPSAFVVVLYLNVFLRMQTLCSKTTKHVEQSDYYSGTKDEDDFPSDEILEEKQNVTTGERHFLSGNSTDSDNITFIKSDTNEENYTDRGIPEIFSQSPVAGDATTASEDFTNTNHKGDVTTAPTDLINTQHTCNGCRRGKNSEADLKKIRIESVKQTILNKLHLSSVPTMTTRRSDLPAALLEAGIRQDEDDYWARKSRDDPFYAKRNRIFITAKDETSHCILTRSTGCYYFRVNRKIAPSEVNSATLMIYKQWDPNDDHAHTFIISELESVGHSKLRARNIVGRIEGHKAEGWIEIDITTTVIRWLNKPHRNDGLSITCKSCRRRKHSLIYGSKGGLRPSLVITTKKRVSSRRLRRTSHCLSTENTCCKASLSIDFEDIGWDWVIHPSRVEVNYCRGSCSAITSARYNHTIAIQALRWDSNDDVFFEQLEPCCSPTAWSPRSILYEDGKGIYIEGQMPNLVVETCGCT